MVLSVKDIKWEELKQEILKQKSFVDKYGDVHKQISLGRVSDLTPSSKHRDFGRLGRNSILPGGYKKYMKIATTDQLRRASELAKLQEDHTWMSNLIDEAENHGIYIRASDDKYRTFIMAGIKIRDRSES